MSVNGLDTDEVAVITTSKGTMIIGFWSDTAPKTVGNFKRLANFGFYDGTSFHRIVKGFMIQGGDPFTKDASKEGMWGKGDPGYKIKAEFNNRPHTRGVVSMARGEDPNSAGSQFFICDGSPRQLDGKYTVFGYLIQGDDVLTKIADTPVTYAGREKSKPTERVDVKSIRIVPVSSL